MAQFHVDIPGETLTVDTSNLTQAVKDYLIHYGLKQCINDAHASITAKTHPVEKDRIEAKAEKANAKLASLLAGEVAQARSGGNPVEKEMRSLAAATVKQAVKSANVKVDKDKLAELVQKYLGKHEEALRVKATEIVAARKEEQPEVDLDELLDL